MRAVTCICCGGPLGCAEQSVPDNPNICLSCARLMDDIQDRAIIESAQPWPLDEPAQAESRSHSAEAPGDAAVSPVEITAE